MALPSSATIISRATTNLNNIKNALEYMGVDTSELTSDNYSDAILNINNSSGGDSEDSGSSGNTGTVEGLVIDDASYLFYRGARANLISTLLPYCKTAKNWKYCCTDCTSLENISFGSEKTTLSNAVAEQAFYNCSNVKNINNLKIEDTAEQNNASAYNSMFERCYNLLSVGDSTDTWVFYSSTNSLFSDCNALTTIPSIEFHVVDGSYMDSVEHMFGYCQALEEIDINIVYEDTHNLYVYCMFDNCTNLKYIKGNLDLSYVTSLDYMFSNCNSLVSIETTGSFGGLNTDDSMTLDLSASEVFDIASYMNSLASNDSGYTRIIKLNATVYNSLTSETIDLASTKNYTLASA